MLLQLYVVINNSIAHALVYYYYYLLFFNFFLNLRIIQYARSFTHFTNNVLFVSFHSINDMLSTFFDKWSFFKYYVHRRITLIIT